MHRKWSNLIIGLLFSVAGYAQKHTNVQARFYYEKAAAFNFNQADSMLFYCDLALKELETDEDTLLFKINSGIASAAQFLGAYSKALEHAFVALRIAERRKENLWLAEMSNKIGLILLFSGRVKESLPYYEKALATAESSNNPVFAGTCNNNIANAYLHLNDFKNSLKYRKQALRLRLKSNNLSALGDTYNDLGETYIKLMQADSAEIYLQKAFPIKKTIADSEMISLILWNWSRVHQMKGEFESATQKLEEAIQYALPLKLYNYAAGLSRDLYQLHESQKQTAKAYQWMKQYLIYNDSALKIENKNQMNALLEEFESEKRDLEIKALRKEKEQQAEINLQKDVQKNLILVGVLLLFAISGIYSFFIYKRFKHSQQQNKIIEEQKKQVEEKQKEVLDSIRYAKRIQSALITNEHYIKQHLNRLQID